MSEAELRESLHAAVADEPPLNFDPDLLIARAETFRRRRRALVAVGVATFALIGTVLALPGVLAPPRGSVDAARVLTTTARPEPSPSVVSAPAPVSVEEGVEHLSGYLTKRVTEVVPTTVDVKVDFSDTRKLTRGHVTGYVFLSGKRGTTSLTVEFIGPPVVVTRAAFCAPAQCDPSRIQPDGSRVEVASSVAPERELFTHMVAHFRLDGTVVVITGHDYDRSGAEPVAPITPDQLIALATDPVLTLTG
ncbi:hypothetical protein AB0A74_10825 [Saccharothrix sp. NPDC042600]|uniref:hypothetical protein n=1 Tax=Saccharothrix TaxID=2071 RepID=UPI0033E317A5|nr:hypothetical protein GCM10017745_09150 [Saccharothrix mutabilis subsp. capreolus]